MRLNVKLFICLMDAKTHFCEYLIGSDLVIWIKMHKKETKLCTRMGLYFDTITELVSRTYTFISIASPLWCSYCVHFGQQPADIYRVVSSIPLHSKKNNFFGTTYTSLLLTYLGTAVARWLSCCAINRKVAGSIPAGFSGFFIDIKFFRSYSGPGVESAPNRNEYQEYFLGVKAAGA